MTIYIAGGITGVEDYKARFAAAQRMLLPEGWPGKVYMDVCLAMIRAADLVVFLPGWEQSRGASLEMQYCRYQIKPVYKIEEEELEGWMEH